MQATHYRSHCDILSLRSLNYDVPGLTLFCSSDTICLYYPFEIQHFIILNYLMKYAICLKHCFCKFRLNDSLQHLLPPRVSLHPYSAELLVSFSYSLCFTIHSHSLCHLIQPREPLPCVLATTHYQHFHHTCTYSMLRSWDL